MSIITHPSVKSSYYQSSTSSNSSNSTNSYEEFLSKGPQTPYGMKKIYDAYCGAGDINPYTGRVAQEFHLYPQINPDTQNKWFDPSNHQSPNMEHIHEMHKMHEMRSAFKTQGTFDFESDSDSDIDSDSETSKSYYKRVKCQSKSFKSSKVDEETYHKLRIAHINRMKRYYKENFKHIVG